MEMSQRSKILFFVAVALILVLGVYMRTGLLKYQGFFEPDGFFHYSVIQQAVANGYRVPATLVLSGFPAHSPITEPLGLYYITIISYIVTGGAISILNIMRLVPMLFGILDIIGTYFLVRYLSKSRVLGLLAMFFVAVSSGDIARTGALVYRGDGFITIFMIVALILLIKAFRSDSLKKTVLSGVLGTVVLGIGTAVWAGAPFTLLVYLLAVLFATVYGFVIGDEHILSRSSILAFLLIISYAIQHLWISIGVIRGSEALSSIHFFIFYLPVLIGSLIAYFAIKNRDKVTFITTNPSRRVGFVILVAIICIAAIVATAGSYLSTVASGGGLVIAGNNLTQSIQELQHPTWQFIWSSFNLQLPLAIIGIVMFILFADRIGNTEMIRMRRGNLNIGIGILAILSYFILTMYLQYNAIRFNSLVAVPIAILAAFAVYSIGRIAMQNRQVPGLKASAVAGIPIAFMIIVIVSIVSGAFHSFGMYTAGVIGVILAAIVALAVSKGESKKHALMYFYIGIVALILFYGILLCLIQTMTSQQADGINSQFLSAMTWMRNNTLRNATVLAIWPDGSVVEGWAQRASATDSVGGQNGQKIQEFANFIFNTSADTSFLYNSGKPEYLVARYYWLQEEGGIAVEAGIKNSSIAGQYGYTQFSSMNTTPYGSSNAIAYTFSSSVIDAQMVVNTTAYNTTEINSFIFNNGSAYPIAHTLLYNTADSSVEEFNSTYSNGYNLTLMVFYSNSAAGQSSSIEGAYMLGSRLAKSNLMKFLFFCGTSCDYGANTSVSLKQVYSNSDTRIYKITYS